MTLDDLDCDDELGDPVVRLTWAGDSAAHSGVVTIYAASVGFLVDTDEDTYGPFDTLGDVLALDTFHFGGTPGPALTCSPEIAASPPLRAAALDLAGGPGGTVRINGVEHVRIANGLMPQP
jgi:hypothetical protein